MKIIFLGSAQFAVASLKLILKSGHEVLCVVTQPDREKGRHLYVEATAVKLVAKEAGLKVFQPKDINEVSSVEYLKKFKADLFIVVAYGQILSQEVIDLPKKMFINAHASLLPKYRGAAPINWAIVRGENETGVTIMKVARKMDSGPIMLQEKIIIKDTDNAHTLEERLSGISAALLVKSIGLIQENNFKLIPQDESKITLAPKLKKEDGLIDWGRTSAEICNQLRGLYGWPGGYTYFKDKILKILEVYQDDRDLLKKNKPGQVLEVARDYILIATAKGALRIEKLQLEGKRIMTASEFISGHKICIGDTFGRK